MSESANDYLKRFLSDVDGVVGLYVSDKDGVIIASGKCLDQILIYFVCAASTEEMPDQAMSPCLVSAFISSLEQATKLGMGAVNWMVTRFQDMVICQFSFSSSKTPLPIFLTVVGTPDCDLGSIIALEPSVRPLLARLAPQAASRLQSEAMINQSSGGQYFRV
ncbi:unnamed protein product [Echinostoma caproni]|uniref:Robl_LC7 domain-containing protein n=1 Tax=Echinostoma caproni TaxID=27848 RepID=A0A183ATI3_9TREM|nr:unnamed protein product [Echinostoma caproni]